MLAAKISGKGTFLLADRFLAAGRIEVPIRLFGPIAAVSKRYGAVAMRALVDRVPRKDDVEIPNVPSSRAWHAPGEQRGGFRDDRNAAKSMPLRWPERRRLRAACHLNNGVQTEVG